MTKVEIDGKTYCVETLIYTVERLTKDVKASAEYHNMVLDKIRDEIEQSFDGYLVVDKDKDYASNTFKGYPAITINHVFEIIDKYREVIE